MKSARFWIDELKLLPHPEGGYYRETYRSREIASKKSLPPRYSSFRSFSTNIVYLLESSSFSAFHRLLSDEMWHFYEGSPAYIHMLHPSGVFRTQKLGRDLNKNESLQILVPKGIWFAVEVAEASSYMLAGCTVSPGFDFDDLIMGEAERLVKLNPEHGKLIRRLCIK